jgi:hypothetical protein
MAYDDQGRVKYYWSANYLYYTLVTSQITKCDQVIYVWKDIYFKSNENVSESIQFIADYGCSEGFPNTSVTTIPHGTTLQIILMWKTCS